MFALKTGIEKGKHLQFDLKEILLILSYKNVENVVSGLQDTFGRAPTEQWGWKS